MRGQTLADTELLLDIVGEAYSFEDLAEYRNGILELVARVVPCDRIAYNEITPQESFPITVPDFDPSLLPVFSALIYENPLIQRLERTHDGRPYRISDLVDHKTFHRLALYREFYRHVGVEWQVAFMLPARAPMIVGIALTRERHDFTDREVQLLALARPHLMHAYRRRCASPPSDTPPRKARPSWGIAPPTVEKHLEHVYGNLGVHSLSEATAIAWAAVGLQP